MDFSGFIGPWDSHQKVCWITFRRFVYFRACCLSLRSSFNDVFQNNFAASLTHLVKLDLSTNQLMELPDNFGLLVNLKHLDLYKNKLQTLPASFGHLRSLRWLDLKENPLVPKMAQVAGKLEGIHYAVFNYMMPISDFAILNKITSTC